MNIVEDKIEELSCMKSYPNQLFYDGNLELLKRTKISIVGSRRPTKYSRFMIQKLASQLAKNGICVVSGGAMGIDAVAHSGAGALHTISVLPCGVDIRYPAVNKNLLNDIKNNGLLLSQFDSGFLATPWSFVVRNELVVALGDVLVVGEAELGSGTMRSVEFALKMGKEIYVLPQRLGESEATNRLLKDNKAKLIYDIDEFAARFSTCKGIHVENKIDDFLEFCNNNPTYDDALKKYPSRVFEAELNGDIEIRNGLLFLT
ncbi:DNA-processing protein DprA [Candidatus Sulfurimonas baltica]|uniref:DNA-protecting protein DprA n=1 Tax=Candidatus Sulfurimonas baltica TaxID=2740404 RepID=A0A7S7RME9_9BACT|nr:DNA-processing protein DprA [Candidatus Sulfurimonas baltica]QOY51479.1 DNA-protecting protein DprA [Candidatus Sulfurimonas baltica]